MTWPRHDAGMPTMSLCQLRWRTIVEVHLNPFDNGRGGTSTEPVFVLDDGTRVWFVVEETETGYGVQVMATKGANR